MPLNRACLACRAASEDQWQHSLVQLAKKVFNTPAELHAWLSDALLDLMTQCTAGLIVTHGTGQSVTDYQSMPAGRELMTILTLMCQIYGYKRSEPLLLQITPQEPGIGRCNWQGSCCNCTCRLKSRHAACQTSSTPCCIQPSHRNQQGE